MRHFMKLAPTTGNSITVIWDRAQLVITARIEDMEDFYKSELVDIESESPMDDSTLGVRLLAEFLLRGLQELGA